MRLKKIKRINNKGFSLIELIIVIAIMAVLVAIIAPDLTSYLSKSKKNADITNADTVRDVVEQACALTNVEVSEPDPSILGVWTEMDNPSLLYNPSAADINNLTAFSKYVAETLGELPKSKVSGKNCEVLIDMDAARNIYTVKVRFIS